MVAKLSENQRALLERISGLLAGSMGAVPAGFALPGRAATRFVNGLPEKKRALLERIYALIEGRAATPYGLGLRAGVAFAVFFCLGPWLAFGWRSVDPHLFWLSVYGAAYVFWAVWIAQSASSRVLETIRTRVIPLLSDTTAGRICELLRTNLDPRKKNVLAWSIAVVGAALSGFVLHRWDGVNSIPQIVWFCIGWLIIYVTAAGATFTARFYLFISKSLKLEQSAIFAVDPPDTALVRAVESVARTVLLFWFGIVVAIAFLYIFDAFGSGDRIGGLFRVAPLFEPRSPSHFVWIVLPVTSFFSFFLGSYVFIQSEYAINDAVGSTIHALLHSIEVETAALLARRSHFTEEDWARVKELTSLHKQVASRSFYRRYLASGISLGVPLITAVVPFIELFARSK